MDILPVEVSYCCMCCCNVLHPKDASELADWRLPLSFMKSRHMEDIAGLEPMEDGWRVKEKVSISSDSHYIIFGITS